MNIPKIICTIIIAVIIGCIVNNITNSDVYGVLTASIVGFCLSFITTEN